MVHINTSGIAQNGIAAAAVGVETCIQHGSHALLVTQHDRVRGVYAGLLIEAAVNAHVLRVLAEQVGREADVIAGHVVHRAAAVALLVTNARAVGVERGVLGLKVADAADRAAVHDLLDLLRELRMAVGVGFFEQNAVCLCGREHFPYLLLGQRHRLFAQDVLAGFGRLFDPLHMNAVRQRQINRVHVLVFKQRLIIGVELFRRKRLGVSLELFFVSACNGVQFSVFTSEQPRNGAALADARASENAPADRLFFHLGIFLSKNRGLAVYQT